jgi:hypothetical protein
MPQKEEIFTAEQTMEICNISSRSKYYELTKPDSRGVVMLEYGRQGAGGKRRHTRQQIDAYFTRLAELGSARSAKVKSLTSRLGERGVETRRGEDVAFRAA